MTAAVLRDGRRVRLRPPRGDEGEARAYSALEHAIVLAGQGVVVTPDERPEDPARAARTLDRFRERAGEDLLLVAEVDADDAAAEGGGEWVGSIDICRLALSGLRHNGVLTMGVHPDWQGVGLGRRLLQAALDWAKAAGVLRIELYVLGDNLRAQRLYASVGFCPMFLRERFLRRPDGTWADDLVMAWQSSPPLPAGGAGTQGDGDTLRAEPTTPMIPASTDPVPASQPTSVTPRLPAEGEAPRGKEGLGLRVYTVEELTVEEGVTPQRAAACRGPGRICWLDVDDLRHANRVSEVGAQFGLHALSIEDILEAEGRAKVEYYPDYVYIIIHMIAHGSLGTGSLETEQISIVQGRDFVLTFQEHDVDVFDRVRKRLEDPQSRVRRYGPDYLTYSLLDAIVDDYFVVLDRIGETLAVLDQVKPADMAPDTPEQVHNIKRQLMTLRKAIRPLRDAVAALERSQGQGDWIQPTTYPFLRDLLDNLTLEMDDLDLYRETCGGILDLYQATADHRMNEEMRVLTVIATIFMPLTFITGLYGMNFDNMPELHSRYGYPAALTTMVLTVAALILYFRRKRWI